MQPYLRDPANNLVEVDWPDVPTLDDTVFGNIPRLANVVVQAYDGLQTTLYPGRSVGPEG